MRGAGSHDGAGARTERRAGGHHVVDEQHASSAERVASCGERIDQVSFAGRGAETRLRRCGAAATKRGRVERGARAPGDARSEERGLVVAAAHEAQRVQRDRHDDVGREAAVDSERGEERAERLREIAAALILEAHDGLVERRAVRTEGVHAHRDGREHEAAGLAGGTERAALQRFAEERLVAAGAERQVARARVVA